jgi:hypothetical protein
MVEVVVFSFCKRAAKRGGASQPPQKRGAEASRVDPEAGPVILAHMRGRLRAALVGEALKRNGQAGRAGAIEASPSVRRANIMTSDNCS